MPFKNDYIDSPVISGETLILDDHFEELKTTINLWLSTYGEGLSDPALSGSVDATFVDGISSGDINDIIIGLNSITTYIDSFVGSQNNSVANALSYCPSFDNRGCVTGFSIPNIVSVKQTGDIIRANSINKIRENIQEQQEDGCYACNTCHDYQNPVCTACFDACHSYSAGVASCAGAPEYGGYNHCNCGYNGGTWTACHGAEGGEWCRGPAGSSCPCDGPYTSCGCSNLNSCAWCNNYNHNGGSPASCTCGHAGALDTGYNFTDRTCTQCYQVGYRYPWNLPNYTVSYNTTANGVVSGFQTPDVGTTLEETVIAGGNTTKRYIALGSPASAYTFTQWSDGETNGTLSRPRRDVAVSNNISVTADFDINEYTFYYGLCGDQNGVLVGDLTQIIPHYGSGTTVSAYPVPASAYEFSIWSDFGDQVDIVLDPISGTIGVRTETNIEPYAISGVLNTEISAFAIFDLKSYTLEYIASSDGTLYSELCGLTDTIIMHDITHYSNGYPICAIADSGFVFSNWTDGITLSARQDLNLSGSFVTSAVFV